MTADKNELAATVAGILADLASLGEEKVKARNARLGAGEDQFGVRMGDIRKVAKKHKNHHELGLALWATGNLEARLLAALLVKPARLSLEQLGRMVEQASFAQLADWVNSYVVKEHPENESVREEWMGSSDPWLARAGWNLTSIRIARSPEGVDLPDLLARIESEMPTAAPPTQWTMNNCLAGIGIHVPELRQKAIDIGEKMGIYRDYPVPKGCTSPFAPIWIAEIVRRQHSAAD